MYNLSVSFELSLPDDLVDELVERVVVRLRQEIERAGQRAPWLDVAGAAEYAAMTPEAIRSAEKRGQLKSHRSSTGRVRFRGEDVDAFLRGD